MLELTPEMGEMPPHWGVYFGVENFDAALEKAIGLGGQGTFPPMDIPDVGENRRNHGPAGGVLHGDGIGHGVGGFWRLIFMALRRPPSTAQGRANRLISTGA